MRKSIYVLPAVAGVMLPAGLDAQQSPEGQPQRRMNIIHIMSDDHSYQTISAYGSAVSKVAPTPNIDRLAEQGMLFTRAYVENSISSPSRATLLTGKYSHQHGKIKLGNGGHFDPSQTIFPVLLQEAGYQTALFGKWHLDIEPYGFDDFKILNGQGTYYSPAFRGKGETKFTVREGCYEAQCVTDYAIDWLEHRDKDKPFYLSVHHKSVHRNWFPEPKYFTLYNDVQFPEPPTLFDDYSTRTDAARMQQMTIEKDMILSEDNKVWQLLDPGRKNNEFNKEFKRMTPDVQKQFIDAYKAENEAFLAENPQGEDLVRWKYQRYMRDYTRCVKSLDDEVGRLLDYLEANGLMENTMIVYCSDQGFYMGEHRWFDKRFMYEESFRTPLIIYCPGMIKPGSVCDELVQNIDFAPTYLAAAGQEIPEEMSGTPLQPLFPDGKAPKGWRQYLYYHYWDYPAIHNVRRHDGVTDKRYKLIHFKDGGGGTGRTDGPIDAWEFYDLKKDPSEINNVYSSGKYAKKVARLKAQLSKFRKDLDMDNAEESYHLEAWKDAK